MGKPATFDDDRSMTNFILSEARTGYQDTAVCHTIVPSGISQFLRQQMRWKRSWLRESIRAASYIWRKEPFMAISFYVGLMMPVIAPLVVLRAFVYLPVFYGIYPTVYIAGLLIMSMLMSASYLLLKRSSIWIYGFFFCFFYLTVLMWQMPWAILTFASAKWGTRETSLEKNSEGGNRKLPRACDVKTEEIDVYTYMPMEYVGAGESSRSSGEPPVIPPAEQENLIIGATGSVEDKKAGSDLPIPHRYPQTVS